MRSQERQKTGSHSDQESWKSNFPFSSQKTWKSFRSAKNNYANSEDHWWIPATKRKPNLLSSEQRRFLFDVLFLYKALNGHKDIDLSNYVQFFKESDYYMLRRKDDCTLKKNYARTNIFKYSYFNRIVDMWNSLPHSVRQAYSVQIFKKSVTDILNRRLWLSLPLSFYFILWFW